MRRSLVAQVRLGDSYALVLALLLASVFLVVAAPEETWARVLRDAVLAGTIVDIVEAARADLAANPN